MDRPTSPRKHSRSFSLRSDKSAGSAPKGKEEIIDKERKDQFWKGGSKANPNAAINEAQPGDKALLEETTIAPLRSIQHTDSRGNVIVDPDLSNPTRSRLERPLDTIRSFENAIDQGYKRRSIRSDSYDNTRSHQSRRSSYIGGYDGPSSPNRYSQVNGGGSYYGGQRPDSSMGAGPPRTRYHPGRQQSDPMLFGRAPQPPQHAHHMSQDTVNTGFTNGSDSTGPWGSSTNPSSENSSIDRAQPVMKQYPDDGYSSYQNTIPEEGGAYPMRNGAGMPPRASEQRRPIALGSSNPVPLPTNSRPEPEKRKSWIKRRFSKEP